MAAAPVGRRGGGTRATMRMLGPAGHLATRAAGRWASDVLLALLAGASAVVLWHNATHSPPGAGMIVVLALMVAPLVVRRIWPIPVFGVMVAATIGTAYSGLWDRRLNDGLARLIAVCTVAAVRPRRAALGGAGPLGVAVGVGLGLFRGRPVGGGAVWPTRQG